MKFSAISRILSQKYDIISCRTLEDVQIFSTSAMKEDINAEDGVLYFSRNLCTMNTELVRGSYIWCGPAPDFLQEYNFNWIRVQDQDFEDIIEEVKSLLLHEYKSQSLHLRMMDIIMNGKGMSALVNEAAKSLNTTIAIIDMSGKVITQSSPFKINDPLWLESIERGFCPPFFIEHLREVRTKQSVAQENQAILKHCLDTHIYYLAKRIYVSGELYGYVFMLQMNKNFSPFAEDALNTIAQNVLDNYIKNKSMDSVKPAFYDNLVIDIFKGISPEQINARIYAGEMKFPKRMCLAAIKPKYFQGDNYVKEKLAKMLKQLFPKALQVYYHKMMIIVFDLSPNLSGMSQEDMTRLRNVCTQEHLCAGISNPFSKVTSMNHYYAQSMRTIELAGRLDLEGNIHEYKDIALYDLIKSDSERNNVGFYCHPALLILREYDNENSSQLHDTLRSLANNGFSNSATAQELFLHRNTLAYRKQKIVSLTGLDLDDFDTQFMLKYSFMIEKFITKDSMINVSL